MAGAEEQSCRWKTEGLVAIEPGGAADSSSLLAQYEQGVWLRGWVDRDVPRAEPVSCLPRRDFVPGERLSEAERASLFLLNDIKIGEQVLREMHAEPLLFAMVGTREGVQCEPQQVRRGGPRGFHIEHPWRETADGERVQWVDTFHLVRGDETFGAGDFGRSQHGSIHTRCGHEVRFVHMDDEIILSVHASSQPDGTVIPYAVRRGDTRGWFRNFESCSRAATDFNTYVFSAASPPPLALTVMRSGGGC